jgi:coproporphyrinogen III oxidase-like Fe-S oxidoreductase
MKINRDILYKLYIEKIEQICDDCDFVVKFDPKTIVDLISSIIEENQKVIETK